MRAVRQCLTGLVVLLMVGHAEAEPAAAPTQSSAIAVSPDGQAVWVVNPDSGTVAEIGANSLTRLGEFKVGQNPRTLALLAAQYVYVTNQDDDTVVRLNQADGSSPLTHQLPYGCAPFGVAVNPDGTRVYVTCERTDTVLVFDPNLTVLATIAVQWPTPRGIAVNADGTRVYVSHFLTKEPNNTGHVTEIDAVNNVVARVFDLPLDTTTCETINSAPGVYNEMSAIAVTPSGSPADVANQVWVAGTKENVVGKGLFERSSYFKDFPEAKRFAFPFTGFPGDDTSSRRRNIYKPSFHEIIRSFIAKIDLTTGTVKDYIDIKGGNGPSAILFSPDGSLAISVDRTSNRFALFNSARTGIVNDDPPTHSPGSCGSSPFDIGSENPLLAAMPPEVELRVDEPAPLEVNGEVGGIAMTGLDYDVSTNTMKAMSDGIGTTPIGAAISPDGQRIYTANFLARTVTVVDARPTSFRCALPPHSPCTTPLDCSSAGPGICADSIHGGAIKQCTADADCNPGIRCTRDRKCLPQIITVVDSTDRTQEPLPPELHDGKILFNISARDSSLPNHIGLDSPVPYTNLQDGTNLTKPGEVVSTGHDAEYLACTSCHVEEGQDGRTWDNSQFGASLRNTMDLRGRSSLAPGTCSDKAADPTRVGKPCTYDSACGTGSPMMTCTANPKFVPMVNPAVAGASERFFDPMGTIHWNGDRDEVEDFEHAFRSLQGAGDCDGNEHLPTKCIGALVMRAFTTDPAETNDDLGAPNRAIPGTSGIAGIRLTHMADYVYSDSEYVRNPNIGAQGEALSFSAMRGRAIFNRVGCAECHNGPSQDNQQFTDKRPLAPGEAGFDPMQPASGTNNPDLRHDVGTANIFDLTDPFDIAMNTAPGGVFPNFALPMPAHRGALTEYVTPGLVDAWNTAPYLHDGSAATLMDVIRPCNTLFEDCNAPGAGRNVNDRHGRTSFLTQDQLNDLEAFLKAPHGPVGTGATQAQLEITSASFSAPDFGYTFAIPYPSGTKVGMSLDGAGHISLNGADFPEASFDTGLAGVVIVDFGKSVFNGTIDSAGNVNIPGVDVMLTLADTPLAYTFNFTTGTKQLPMDPNKVTGVPFDPEDGSMTLVDLETGPPVPVLGMPTDTVLRIGGYLDTAPLIVSRAGMISGVVRDTMGHPVPGVRIALRHGTKRNAVTDANGQFSFRNLRLTGYVLRFSKPKAGRARARVLLNAAHPTAAADATLQ